MKASRRELFFSIAAITLTTIITYAALIPQLGFYRDDWYLVWTAQTQGTEGILSLFRGDRPFDGWLYVLDFWMMGVSPLAWHIYALCIKLFSAFAFLWLMRSLWENRKLQTTFITLLFVVYPGFYQQPDALTFKQLLIAYAAALLSLALTISVVKTQKTAYKVLYTILAALLSAFYMLIYEALAGIEVARVLLLFYFFYRQNKEWKQALRSAFINGLPYFLFMASFIIWRLFIFEAKRKSTDAGHILENFTSLHGLVSFVIEFGKDLIETSFFAWGVPLYQFSNQAIYKDVGLALGAALLAAMVAAGYYFATRNKDEGRQNADAEAESAWDWIALGALIVFVTTFPIVAAGRNAIFGIQWDRYTYQSVLGVALLMGGFIFYAVKGNLRWALFAFLLMSGVMTQVFSANYYRGFWKAEREMWWQLSWRAPQIEDGSTLIVSLPGGFGLAEEYEVWGPANMIYHPNDASVKISGQIMFSDVWKELARGTQEERTVRNTIKVSRNYGKALILSQPSPYSCLHVLDGRRFEQAVTERVDVRLIAQYSNAALIQDSQSPAVPPRAVFGEEPAHTWCYYYQKMDWARQNNEWNSAAKLANEAIALGLEPYDISEWMPALEAYVHTENAKSAKRIANLIYIDRPVFVSLCTQYKILRDEPADYDRALVFEALCAR